MGKRAQIRDAFGQRFDVSAFRGTVHGFDLVFGGPVGKKRGTGGCVRPGVVLTKELVRHMEKFRMTPGKSDLPLGLKAVTRIRRRLGHRIRHDIRAWWEKRRKDLAALSGTEFAAKHGKSTTVGRFWIQWMQYANRLDPAQSVPLGLGVHLLRRGTPFLQGEVSGCRIICSHFGGSLQLAEL
jgi:hypothetical protein